MGTVKLGVTGAGHTSLRNATELIADWAQAQGEDTAIVVVLDLTLVDGELPPGPKAAAGFVRQYGLGLEAVLPQDQKDSPSLADLLEAAGTVVKVANTAAGVARRSDVLFVAWDEQEVDGVATPTAAAIKALEASERFSVPAHDLADGLLPLSFDDGEEAEEEPKPAQRSEESTSADQAEPAPDTGGVVTATDSVEELATKVAAAVLAEVLPLFEQLLAQTAPRPRGRPRKNPEEE